MFIKKRGSEEIQVYKDDKKFRGFPFQIYSNRSALSLFRFKENFIPIINQFSTTEYVNKKYRKLLNSKEDIPFDISRRFIHNNISLTLDFLSELFYINEFENRNDFHYIHNNDFDTKYNDCYINYNFMIYWIGNILLNPDSKTGKVIVLIGAEGKGKTTFLFLISKLLGMYFGGTTTGIEKLQNFNSSYFKNSITLLIGLEEVFSDSYTLDKSQEFKHIITSNDIEKNTKFKETESIPNYINFIITSNIYQILTENNVRRIFQIPVDINLSDKTSTYFQKIYDQSTSNYTFYNLHYFFTSQYKNLFINDTGYKDYMLNKVRYLNQEIFDKRKQPIIPKRQEIKKTRKKITKRKNEIIDSRQPLINDLLKSISQKSTSQKSVIKTIVNEVIDIDDIPIEDTNDLNSNPISVSGSKNPNITDKKSKPIEVTKSTVKKSAGKKATGKKATDKKATDKKATVKKATVTKPIEVTKGIVNEITYQGIHQSTPIVGLKSQRVGKYALGSKSIPTITGSKSIPTITLDSKNSNVKIKKIKPLLTRTNTKQATGKKNTVRKSKQSTKQKTKKATPETFVQEPLSKETQELNDNLLNSKKDTNSQMTINTVVNDVSNENKQMTINPEDSFYLN